MSALITAAEIAAAAAAVASVPGLYAYASMYPGSTLFGRALIAGRDPSQAALTFDDGPNGDTTLRLLDILAEHRVRATFFLVGRYVRAQPDVAKRIVAAGHLVANHTESHPHLAQLQTAQQREELSACSATLRDVLGIEPKYFRTPFGSRSYETMRLVRELGMTSVLWNCVGWDWKRTSGEVIANDLERQIARNRRRGKGSNILLHDGSHRGLGWNRNPTLDAVQRLLSRQPGTQFVTVDAFNTEPS